MSDDNANLQRVERIEADLKLCVTFIVMAASKYESGDIESAERSLSNAENIYATVVPLVSDPKHSKHLNAEQIQKFTAELNRLRERLDRLRPVLKVRTAR
jgi:hypothetical protein